MADWSKPTTTSTYSNYTSEGDARLDDLAMGLDPAYTSPTNLPTNTLRFTSASGKWERWNGSTWVDAVTTYGISISGNAGTATKWATARTLSLTGDATGSTGSVDGSGNISVAVTLATVPVAKGGTGATDAATARTNLGLGSAATLVADTNPTANTVVQRNASGYAFAVYYSTSAANSENPTVSQIMVTNGTDNYMRKASLAHLTSAIQGVASGSWGISITGNAATATSATTAGNVTGTVAVANGGTGATTLTGLVKGNGTGAFTTVTAPSGTVVGTSDTQTLTNKTLTNPIVTNPDNSTSTLSDGATLAWNMNSGQIAVVTIAGNRTVAAPTNMKKGTYIFKVIQDATGNRTLTWNAVFKWPLGIAPTLSTAGNSVDVFSFYCDGTNMYGSMLKGMA